MDHDAPLREHLAKLLDWDDAHASFDAAVAGLEPRLRGAVPAGLPHSAWQLVEHLRRAQRDILEFCTAASYSAQKWPDDYWPPKAAPASEAEWDEAVEGYRHDLETLRALARDPGIDLLAAVPNGTGQTYLRELLLVADHTSYHVGQLVLVRRALGAWG
jgi:uncharacterized damage-inducible protein DinB